MGDYPDDVEAADILKKVEPIENPEDGCIVVFTPKPESIDGIFPAHAGVLEYVNGKLMLVDRPGAWEPISKPVDFDWFISKTLYKDFTTEFYRVPEDLN